MNFQLVQCTKFHQANVIMMPEVFLEITVSSSLMDHFIVKGGSVAKWLVCQT